MFLFVVFLVFPTPSWAADWQDIRDAILGKEAVTQEMDVNKDGKVDVADVLKNLKDSPVSPDENR